MLSKALTAALLVISSSVMAAGDTQRNVDPLEPINRATFAFNDTLDRWVVKPVAQGYRAVTPDLVETGVSNVFDNLGEVSNVINNGLQGKFTDATTSAVRLIFNSSIGLFGLLDVATPMGLQAREEDFGQTLAVWGVDAGPYVVVPLLGPSTLRDVAALPVNQLTNPVTYIDDAGERNAMVIAGLIDRRSRLLASEAIVSGDRYGFIRDAYLQRRDFDINDGAVNSFDDDNF